MGDKLRECMIGRRTLLQTERGVLQSTLRDIEADISSYTKFLNHNTATISNRPTDGAVLRGERPPATFAKR